MMHNLKLVEKTDTVLRTPAQPVLENELNLIEEYTRDMSKIMLQSKGIGLAAPQVGIAKTFFIYGPEDNIQTVINPEVTAIDGEMIPMVEGCLSLPGEHYNVLRPDKSTLSYYDINWKKHTESFTGFMSRVVQHETDHLNGIMIDKKGIKTEI
jgi:peptide deformylase